MVTSTGIYVQIKSQKVQMYLSRHIRVKNNLWDARSISERM